MQFYNSITEYWNESIKYKRIQDEEEEQIEKYGFNINYQADILYHGYLFDFVSHKNIMNNKTHLLNIHNKNSINLIFVDYSMRIITNNAFINNIPFFKNIIDGKWKQDNIFRSHYYNKNNEKAMYDGQMAKYKQNPELKQMLLLTKLFTKGSLKL